MERERNVFGHVARDDVQSARVTAEGCGDEVCVVAAQVVEDDGDDDVRPSIHRLPLEV